MFRIIPLILLLSLSNLSVSALKLDSKLIICAEDAGWPPFSIPGESVKDYKGFNLEVLKEILSKHKIDFEVVIRPWKRCLHDGMKKDVHIVLDAAKNPQREKDYYLSGPIYKLTPVVFYHKKNKTLFSKKISPKKLTELELLCGQKGYTYNNFGLKNIDVSMVAKKTLEIADLVIKERCSAGLTRLEVFNYELRNYKFSKDLMIQKIKGAKSEDFYWLVNKNYPFSKQLSELITKEAQIIQSTGQSSEILRSFN